MGCATSKTDDGTKCNKDVCERRKMLTGTNFQFAIERKAKKTYEVSAIKKPAEDPEE